MSSISSSILGFAVPFDLVFVLLVETFYELDYLLLLLFVVEVLLLFDPDPDPPLPLE